MEVFQKEGSLEKMENGRSPRKEAMPRAQVQQSSSLLALAASPPSKGKVRAVDHTSALALLRLCCHFCCCFFSFPGESQPWVLLEKVFKQNMFIVVEWWKSNHLTAKN